MHTLSLVFVLFAVLFSLCALRFVWSNSKTCRDRISLIDFRDTSSSLEHYHSLVEEYEQVSYETHMRTRFFGLDPFKRHYPKHLKAGFIPRE